MTHPTCIELFAGAGGASLGLHRAGFQSLLAAEWDSDACETHRAAELGRVVEGDVRDLGEDLEFGEPPFLMWASPPCQAFSSAGKRLGALDERNGWPWTLDILDTMEKNGCRPTWVICENVPGLTFHRADCPRDPEGSPFDCPGCYWERWIIPEFEKRFAHVTVGVLDAADFGVPQRRRRVFLIAGPEPYEWPTPTHSFHNLVHDKWVSGAYWKEHGMERPKKGPSPTERKVLESVAMTFGGREEGIKPWATVRDALGLGYPIRHQSPSAFAVQHLPDETAPAVSVKGTLYAEAEVQDVGRHNPHYHDPEAVISSTNARSKVRGTPTQSVDEPSFTMSIRGDRMFVGDEESVRNQSDPLLESPDTTFASQLTPDPKHPEKSIDEPATGIRGGGDGNDAPHYWLRQESTASVARSIDEPGHPVATTGMLYLHNEDPGERGRKHPDPAQRRERKVIGGGHNPNTPEDSENRNYRDLTDEPSTTISAQPAGNAGPWLVDVPKGAQTADADDPSPTIRAGGSVDASGKLGGGAPPYLDDIRLLERKSGSRGLEAKDVDGPSPTVLGGDGVRGWDRLQMEEGTTAPEPEAEDEGLDFFDFLEAEDEPPKKELPMVGAHRAVHDHQPGDLPELMDNPIRTVSATEAKGASSLGKLNRASDDLFLATGRRRLTVTECAILQGFPEDYPLKGTSTSQYKQVGNAVCPQVAEALGRMLLER